MKPKKLFTMVEMLVVIAIIAVLAALLFPAVGGARQKARTTACLSNQKQVIAAINHSLSDNNNYFYSIDYTAAAENGTANKSRWTQRLYDRKYIGDFAVMRCTEIVSPVRHPGSYKADAFTYGAAFVPEADSPKGIDLRGTRYLMDRTASPANEISPSALALGGCSWNDTAKGGGALMKFTGSNDAIPYGKLLLGHRKSVNLFFLDGRAVNYQEKDIASNATLYFPEWGTGTPKESAVLIPKNNFNNEPNYN